MEFSGYIKSIPLAKSSSNSGLDVIVIGNGFLMKNKPKMAPVLEYTLMQTIENKKCAKIYPTLKLRNDVICAERIEGNGHREQGSPLVAVDTGELVGIASFMKDCEDECPQGFIRISSVRAWINATITGIIVTNGTIPNF